MISLAETIADHKFVLGDRLVEIGISGPDLEATLSSIAMAQAELGHARLIYRWVADLKGENGSKQEIKQQTGKAFQSLVEINNWITLIAGLYTTNVAIDLVMKALLKGDHKHLNLPFSKMLKEQHEHVNYSKSWSEQLLNERGSIPLRFEKQLEKASFEVEQWLNKVEKDNTILANSNLTEQFNETIKSLYKDGVVTNV